MKKLSVMLLLFSCLLIACEQKNHYENKVIALIYHDVDDIDRGVGTVSTDLFNEQLQYLLKNKYHFISLDELKLFLLGEQSVPPNALLLTFDDGYENFYKYAYPILKRNKIPSVVFMITGKLDDPTASYEDPPLTGEQIRSIVEDETGLVCFQCHSDHQHKLGPQGQSVLTFRQWLGNTYETDLQYANRVEKDTETCTAKLYQLTKKKVDAYAYPYGEYTEELEKILAKGGIRFGFTTKPGFITKQSNWMELPRVSAGFSYVTPDVLGRELDKISENK